MKKTLSLAAFLGVLLILPTLMEASIGNPSLLEYHHLGGYYINTGQFDLAIANNNAMIAKHPTTREAEYGWLGIGHCYYQLMLRSLSELQQAKARGDVPKRELEEMAAKVNSNMLQALTAYRKVSSQFPASKAEAIIGIALTYSAFGSEKQDVTMRELKKVIDDYPEEAGRAQLLVGDVYSKNEDAASAEQAYSLASVTYPEVASLALSRYADANLKSEEYGAALDAYTTIVQSLGIDGAYDTKLHFVGSVAQNAIEKRGEGERALGSKEDELNGYRSAYARYVGTNVGMTAQLKLAEALWHYGRSEEAARTLKQIMDDYPRSIWRVRAMMLLAKLQGSTNNAVETYQKLISAYPSSIHRVQAQFKLAEVYLAQAEKAEDPGDKKKLKAKSKNVCEGIIADYPLCPEGEQAKNFVAKNKL
jgi:tetratricopeptide (TPR) repeat protein